MNYPDSVQFLYALGNEVKTAKLGLERIATVLEALGNPQQRGRFVHVAGTNGKGSTCAMIESALRAAGIATGLFTSPHLVEPTERIRIGGMPVSADGFTAAFERVHGCAEELLRTGAIDLHPTYFETVTAMAFLLFEQLGAGVVALEVGLGGRLDATNVVRPQVAVITPVDFDHEAYLGRSLETIASEKAGILKAGAPAVFAAQRPEADAKLTARAAELDAPVTRSAEWQVCDVEAHRAHTRFRLRRGDQELHIHCPLPGAHQIENARTAAAALALLEVPAAAIEKGIARTRWPGRLERVAEHPEIILDGAHNPAGARALRAYIEQFYSGRQVWLIYGAMRDKAVAEMAGILFPVADQVIATAPRQARAVRPETIAELAGRASVRVAPRLEDALAQARAGAAADDVVFVAGSLFLVGEAKSLI
jgi:dihydrofolate synthase / folylpolyglutamate synthase